ncbi:hypothetical protein RBH26_20640 [Natronolimnohabitans sp. A-GB9]|uniref:hypothetical protein n=1 Tax=Natronolimnohabitans sp. A-GB9 TaxID=3069757 RepID=UPI0027B2990D|nr:hypothetical protein [Natronolimnohabitans sp. A-GB9]MDQ2052853.1 hypothetical protein [Natronolimnohabitans sp. A-GB9]
MSDEGPKIWIDHYDLNLGVVGGDQDTIEAVEEIFDEKLEEAVDRDPKLGDDVDDHISREVQ